MTQLAQSTAVECHRYGDAALMVEVHGGDRERCWSQAQALGQILRRERERGVTDVLATYRHVLVCFDPLVTDVPELCEAIITLAKNPAGPAAGRCLDIPVQYGGDFGPDLAAVGEDLGLGAREVVAVHTSRPWIVRFLGSPLAAPFLEGPRFPKSVPRLSAPRTRVPTGSVAVSGQQCTVYTGPSPGGWRIIGRTPLPLFSLERDPFVEYRPGDSLRFIETNTSV